MFPKPAAASPPAALNRLPSAIMAPDAEDPLVVVAGLLAVLLMFISVGEEAIAAEAAAKNSGTR